MKNIIENINKALVADQNETALELFEKLSASKEDSTIQLHRIDALIGCGRLKEAKEVLEILPKNLSMEEKDYSSVLRGILLSESGCFAEALDFFEEGLHPEELLTMNPMRLYNRIWREIAMAHFGDLGSARRLLNLSLFVKEQEEKYLVLVADTFSLVTKALLKQQISKSESESVISGIRSEQTPGLMVFAKVASLLGGAYSDTDTNRIIREIVQDCLRCQGIKGDWSLISEFITKYSQEISQIPENGPFKEWLLRYGNPVFEEIKHQESLLFPNLPETPYLRSMNCAHCDGRCCYDGVYITTEQEAEIRLFMAKYPEYFTHVPADFMEDGEWGFLFGGKRTKRVQHQFTMRNDYPAHFSQTKCILAYPNGECALQKAATEKGYHPWKYKPTSCWEFPMIGFFNDDAMIHPHYFGVPDPGYCDEKNPGYVSFMPCAKTFDEGISWKKVYKNEIQYFLYQQKKKTK